MNLIKHFLFISSLFSLGPFAYAASYHEVGWLNAFVPGGGAFLLGHTTRGVTQASLEIGTFGIGYSLSKWSPMTLDGVPEELPNAQVDTTISESRETICTTSSHGNKSCKTIIHRNVRNNTSQSEVSNIKGIAADILQEFGLKYHFVNTYESYREASLNTDGTSKDPWMDTTSTKDLFLAPLNTDYLMSPWVYAPLIGVLGFAALDFAQSTSDPNLTIQPMKSFSNTLYGFNYVVWQPIGSGAPEEMFFRGFLQNEAHYAFKSPWASIPAQATVFALAHSPEGHLTAAITGTYLGILAQKNHGKLGEGIALHYWSDFILGLTTVAITYHAQGKILPIGFDLSIPF